MIYTKISTITITLLLLKIAFCSGCSSNHHHDNNIQKSIQISRPNNFSSYQSVEHHHKPDVCFNFG